MEILVAWLIADLISGIVHWYEDRCLVRPQRFKFLEAVRLDNDLHHAKPTAMLKYTAAENINTSVIVAWPLAAALFAVRAPVVIWLAVFFSGFANLVHRFAHMPAGRIPVLVRWLQVTGLFLSPQHHHGHHFMDGGSRITKLETTRRYCVMTDWLNPIIDWVSGKV